MLAARKVNSANLRWVFPNESGDGPFLVTLLGHQQEKVRASLHMPADFVVHSFRHTVLTRLGLAGAYVFTTKKLAGHSSVQVSEKYVHPCSESNERAIERMMSEYAHIGGHDTVDGDAMRASSAEHPHKSPDMVEAGTSAESPQLSR
jgi:integrase